jgi:predicted DNA-binding protein
MIKMPAKNPRINVVLDMPLYNKIQFLAERDGVSLSTKVRDLIKEAMETNEDIYLAAFAEEREQTLTITTTLTHEEAWS